MIAVSLAAMVGAANVPACAAGPATRPHIMGLSHVAFYVHDIEKTRAFYKTFLGFAEPYSIKNPDGSLHLTWIKINDRQTIELFPETAAGTDRLYHIALETDDAAGMRDYLAARGVKVPEKVGTGKIGNLNYFIKDPNGHIVEIVQYQPSGWTMLFKGKFLPETRISELMTHAGILVGDLGVEKAFYEDILGFKEIWRGSKNDRELSWVHERVPDGTGFLEFMLYSQLPEADRRGTAHHFCLQVPDIRKAKAILDQRAGLIGYTQAITVHLGVNRKWQLNVYDPDGTRVELMEPTTVDGKAAMPSTAPVPPTATQPTI